LSFLKKFSTLEPSSGTEADDPVMIIYSSGTTGRPKGALIPHKNLFWICVDWLLATDLTSEERVLAVLPLFHRLGLMCPGALNVYKGWPTVLMRSFEPTQLLETVRRERISMFFCVPTMLNRLLEISDFEKYLRGVRIFVGAGPLPVHMTTTCLRHGLRLGLTYGSLEGGDGTFIGPDELAKKPESAGSPFFHTEIKIVDDLGAEVQAGQIGELMLKGPTVMERYWNNPEGTSQIIEKGWLHTGDLARVDEGGSVYIVGRKKDMILTGGEHIYPAEVEALLEAHPKIAEIGVIGQSDEIWGEAACAVIRPKAGQTLTADEVINFCQGKLARYKIPRRVIFTNTPLPRNPMGKIVKQTLREQLRQEGKIP
jgi:fatty-acyl-CoA synthase